MGTGRTPGWVTRYSTSICVCGKGMYASRRLARAAGKRINPGEHLSAYRCPRADGEVWHVGHARQWRHTRYHHHKRLFGQSAA